MRRSRLVFLFFFLALAFNAFVFAQDEPLIPEDTTPAVERSTPAAKSVTAIEVRGNKNISTNVVISKMKTKVGSPYQENVISDDLKRLYLLGFFSDIKIDTEDYKDGLKVIITVSERPIIEKITFSGMTHLYMKEEKIKENLKSKTSQYLDYPTLAEDIKTLKKLYEKKGFGEVEIDYQVDVNKETNKAAVNFNVAEGKKIKIRGIAVEGNNSFPDRKVLRLMKTKKAWLFNAGVLKEEVLKEDIERVKAFYHRGGFADANVEYAVNRDAQKKSLYIAIKINEGKKYLVGTVTIEGNKEVDKNEILARIKNCIPGKVFSQEALKEDIASIQGIYFDRGYIFAQAREATALNAYTGRIDIVYNISENEVAYVNKIKIRGNVKTKDVVVRRELRIRSGDKFDGDKLRRSKDRLQNLGFFDEISYDTEDTATPNKKDLIVDVKEAKTGAFSFGGGYSTVDQFMGFVEVEQKNFDWKNFPYFTGDGQDLRFRATFGTLNQGFDLSFTEPWVFDYPVSFGFDAYKQTREKESDTGYGYDEDIAGGDLRLGKEISEYVKATLKYRYDTIKISNVDPYATDALKREEGRNSISSTEFGLSYDSRDNVYSPTKGDLVTGTIEGAGGPFAGDKDFWKFSGRGSHYIPLFRGSSIELRARVGLVEAYGDSDWVPIYERYFAGGAYTIRGYRERKVGPFDPVTKDPLGGDSMFIGNLEYTYPLFDFLKLAAFYDTGNVWGKIDQMDLGELKSGFGFGVRIKTPIGPIMLDYGIPLDKESGEDKKSSGRLHFSMSHGF